MKKYLLIILGLLYSTYTMLGQTYTWSPEFFEDTTDNVTLTVSGFNPNTEWSVSDIYLWAWHFDNDGTQINNPTAVGNDFGNSPETAKFTDNGNGTYSFNFGKPEDFFANPNYNGVSRIGFLLKSQDGTSQTIDSFKDVGIGNIIFITPTQNTVIVNSGDNLSVQAQIELQGSLTAGGTYTISFTGTADNTPLNSMCGFPNCTNTIQNITSGGIVTFSGTPPSPNNTITIEDSFQVIVSPTVVEEALPAGLKDGINYDTMDATKATLVLTAPNKDFIEVAGSFNNYQPQASDVMKRDPSTGKYWLEITGLTSGQVETYQYWVYDTTPISGSPVIVKAADPYSTLVLSPFDDPFIPASSYPNLPTYPAGQEREVTVLQTGQTPYNWVVSNFDKPKEEDLIVYEVLVRDFDANRNYQDIIDRIDYFKNLNINAIELMPVMEFEGNESWGYNTAYHMALDKFYGTPDKFKELVDVCHQNGIAVILDIAFNHAFGRNPLVRMWMDDPDGDGWGGPSTENPFFNTTPQHAFNVGSDFDHSSSLTRDYVKHVIEYWVEEYKIDGYRWDLTKGFTQNCGNGTDGGDFGCTQNYQQDRIDVLKEYIDHVWAIDPDHYSIFEHLGNENEEKEWANYRLGEGKGVMMWGKMTSPYSVLARGYYDDPTNPATGCDMGNGNISGVGHKSRPSFQGKRLIGYAESHDEERILYQAMVNGNTSGTDATTFESRARTMSSIGAILLTIPGPKMIWHFGDLAMENSIFTRQDGVVNSPDGSCAFEDGGAIPGDSKLDTKPQPQWANNWLSDANRGQVYHDWSRLNALKITEDVFEGDYTINTSITPRIRVFDTSISNTELNDVIVIANFDVIAQNVNPQFTAGVGTWYDLMDETGSTTVTGSTTSISIPAGEFRIFGNQSVAALSTNDVLLNTFSIYPNPANTSFQVNANISDVEVYDITGKLVKGYKGSFTTTDIFDISSLKSGIYILRAKNQNNQTSTSKLIKL
ncbi:alpha-amylase family glycosyl hydrolase [Winogradskyella haliclonae]|nr:alpha-amylase family glycosyl hydrolase [Winogradskyella haliclonae]